jgi:transcription antitermination factor NusG
MLDTDPEVCQFETITAPVPLNQEPLPCRCNGGAPMEIKFPHGGARPGAGRKPKPQPSTQPAITNDPRWCVIAFWGQAEISATTELARIGYETYLPLRAIRRRDPVIASMWHTVRVPLFSGYGFIRLAPSESREPIRDTRGVREVLRRPDGRPAWVRDGLIDKLRDDDVNRLLLPKERGPALDVGTQVRIEEGPFLGHTGAVVQCDGVMTQVEINMFGRPTPVWLGRLAVVVV